MGDEVNRTLDTFREEELPGEVGIFRITDQSEVVGDSLYNFLKELVIAIAAVVIVVVLLLPLRVALVAASTIPVTIFISLGLLYGFGVELNTVSLAALIVTLGMIVDNSIVIIDSYLEKLGEGMSRWHASIESANTSSSPYFQRRWQSASRSSLSCSPRQACCTISCRHSLGLSR